MSQPYWWRAGRAKNEVPDPVSQEPNGHSEGQRQAERQDVMQRQRGMGVSVERQTRTDTTSSSAIWLTSGQGMDNPTWQPSLSTGTRDSPLISFGSVGASDVLRLQGK